MVSIASETLRAFLAVAASDLTYALKLRPSPDRCYSGNTQCSNRC
jgi:hypothetical protein